MINSRSKAVGDPQISPDGRWVAYTVSGSDLKKEESKSRIWMIPTEGGDRDSHDRQGQIGFAPTLEP